MSNSFNPNFMLDSNLECMDKPASDQGREQTSSYNVIIVCYRVETIFGTCGHPDRKLQLLTSGQKEKKLQ